MAEDEEARRRRDEVARLRAAAGATTPDAYKVRRAPEATSADPMTAASESYTTLFGAFTRGKSLRQAISVGLLLGANGIAWIIIILMLNLAQCSWWYERGMYTDPDYVQSTGR